MISQKVIRFWPSDITTCHQSSKSPHAKQKYTQTYLDLPELFYAQAVMSRRVVFDDLCDEIAETCTLTSADIKAVLDRVIWAMVTHLRNGEIVQFADLGNFRIAIGSPGVSNPEDFNAVMIRRPKVVFSPGKRLRNMRNLAKFNRFTVDKDEGGGV